MTHYPVVIEREASGVWSAYVAGLPVYAQGPTAHRAELAIARTLRAYLADNPEAVSRTVVRVATVTGDRVQVKSPAAFLGRATSARKATAARRNGRLGGRPRLHA